MLLQSTTKLIVFVLFVVYLGFSFWGAPHIITGLKLESIVPPESYLAHFVAAEEKFYSHQGPVVSFLIEGEH